MDEMTNSWAVILVIVIFVFMNVMMMNLLIAMMSNTCKLSLPEVVRCSRARSSRQREREERSSCALPAASWSRV